MATKIIKRYGTLAECLKVVKLFQKKKHSKHVVSIECSPLDEDDPAIVYFERGDWIQATPAGKGWLGSRYKRFSQDQYHVVTLEFLA